MMPLKNNHTTILTECFRSIRSGSTPPKKNMANFVTGEGVAFIKGEHITKELHRCAEEDESSNPGLFLSVDRREFKDLAKYRVHSRTFDIRLPENPIGGAPGPDRAVSDGYWVILEPLSPGKHDIHFKASLSNPTTGILFYNDDLKYTINIR